jgi:RHS repeat-associated protein
MGTYGNIGNTAAFVYDAAGRLQSQTINNAMVSEYAYDGLDRLTGINHRLNNNSLLNFQYGYGNDHNITEIIDYGGMHTYNYDGNAQLTSATHSAMSAEMFNYDSTGTNLTAGGTLAPTGVNYTYDINGDLKTRVDNRIPPGGPKRIEYKYDALGRLVERKEGIIWVRYTYSGDDVVLDEISLGLTYYYANGPGIDNKLWHWPAGPWVWYYLKDHLGSTRALASDYSTTVDTITYDSFGKPLGNTSLGTRFLYAGRDYDADTELYYYRARWYDPQLRRFISEDPIGLNGGINLYAYVGNNPINATDPSGLEILVQWHKVLGTGNYHTLITITPENQDLYKNDPRFIYDNAQGKYYATIGAGPSMALNLTSGINREKDKEPHKGGNKVDFNGCEDNYITKLFTANNNYANNPPLPYDLFPTWPFNVYNSNSYISGIINATSGVVEKPNVNAPGWNRPVPSKYFTPR